MSLNYHQRSEVWRSLNSDNDIQRIFNGCGNLISYMFKIAHKLQREDIEELQRELEKEKIAIDRIEQFPEMFSFTQEQKDELIAQYDKHCEEVHKIDMRRLSWD